MRTSFRMEDENIVMVRGDTLSFGVEFYGLSQDLDSAFFTCKSNRTDAANVFQKYLGNGISKIDYGQYVVRVAPEDTKDIDAGKYYYDLEISVNNDVFTIMKGVLEIEQDVTW